MQQELVPPCLHWADTVVAPSREQVASRTQVLQVKWSLGSTGGKAFCQGTVQL